MTTNEAAIFLNVSSTYVVRLLEGGRIPYHKVGTQSRIRYEDLILYKEERQSISGDALQELVDQAQALGLGY